MAFAVAADELYSAVRVDANRGVFRPGEAQLAVSPEYRANPGSRTGPEPSCFSGQLADQGGTQRRESVTGTQDDETQTSTSCEAG